MAHSIFAQLENFFQTFEQRETEIQDLIKKAEKPLDSIRKQSVLYRAAADKNSVVNTPFEKLEGFREALIDNIFTALQFEYNQLEEIRNQINQLNESLRDQKGSLSYSYLTYRSECLNNSDSLNPCCPSLEYIIEWSEDIWRYYHSFYLQISQALLNLNYEDKESVNALVHSFKENNDLKNTINKIRSLSLHKFKFTV